MFESSLARLRNFTRHVGKCSLAALSMCAAIEASTARAQQPAQPATSLAPRAPQPGAEAPAVQTVAYAAQPNSTDGRLEELESTVQDLQRQLQAATAENQPEERYKIGSNLRMRGTWNHGLEFRSANNDFYVHVGGRTQFDNTWLGSPDEAAALNGVGTTNDGLQAGTFFRRARLRMEGTAYDQFDWCMEYNFVNSFLAADPTKAQASVGAFQGNDQSQFSAISTAQSRMFNPVSPVDLWWNVRDVPVLGNIQFGNMKEPFALERLESSRYLDFMERNYGNDAFISPSANGFAPGVMFWNWVPNRRGTYAFGVFKNVTNPFVFNVGDGQNEWAGRVTYLPWYDEPSGGRYFMHVGIGGCQRVIDNGFITYRNRGDLRNGPDAMIPSWSNTGGFFGDYQYIINPEFMFQYGRLFIQSEYVCNITTNAQLPNGAGAPVTGGNIPGTALGQVVFTSYYAQATYFLTGEHRIYDYQKALVGRVVPFENTFAHRRRNGGGVFGRGAWQAKARFNYIDLNDSAIHGGRLTGQTYGLNWFWNPNMKVQFDFDIMQVNSQSAQNVVAQPSSFVTGLVYGFGTRFAADF